MQEIKRCMGCMQELKEKSICTECSYNNEKQKNPERALPLRTILNGKYLIGKVIGEGGFGITYMAWDILIGYRIAIKEYFPSELVTRDTTMQDEKSMQLTIMQKGKGEEAYKRGLERFIKEAENLARFQGLPGIVSVKDFFYENNTAYMVMEYIEGMTLKNYLFEHEEKLSVEQTFQMIEPVMKTLQEIHKEGIVHRDISPDNIMITKEGQMKLIDFGASRFINAEDEKSLTIILKHGYAPEEQYRSKGKQGPWTDVYALSATIYRMLTGKVPEEAIQRMTTGDNKVHKELAGMRELSDIRRKSLEKGLAVKAEKRYQSVEELYEGLYCEKRNSRKSIFVGIAVIVFLMVGILIGYSGNIGKKEEVIQDNIEKESVESETLETEISETEMVMKEAETQEEEIQEPEYIRRLREYYNENYSHYNNQVYFVDLTGDGEDELIVTYLTKSEENAYRLYNLDICQYKIDRVVTIYSDHEISSGKEYGSDYFLRNDGENWFILRKKWEKQDNDFKDNKATKCEKLYYNKEDVLEVLDISFEEFEEKCLAGIMLLSSSLDAQPSWKNNNVLDSVEDVIELKEIYQKVEEIAAQAVMPVLDFNILRNGEEQCVVAVSGNINESVVSKLSNTKLSVWNYVETIEEMILLENSLIEIFCETAYISGCNVAQFGNQEQYFVNIKYPGMEYVTQYKYVLENGELIEINENNVFGIDDDGRVIAYFYEEDIKNKAGIYYHDSQYVEYGCNEVLINTLYHYENFEEIDLKIKQKLYEMTMITASDNVSLEGNIGNAEIDSALLSKENYLYVNYIVKGSYIERNSSGYYNEDRVKPFERYVHAEIKINGNILELKDILYCGRYKFSNLGLPIYFGEEIKKSDEYIYIPYKYKAGKDFTTYYGGYFIDEYTLYDLDNDNIKEYLGRTETPMGEDAFIISTIQNEEVIHLGTIIGSKIFEIEGEIGIYIADWHSDKKRKNIIHVIKSGNQLICQQITNNDAEQNILYSSEEKEINMLPIYNYSLLYQ